MSSNEGTNAPTFVDMSGWVMEPNEFDPEDESMTPVRRSGNDPRSACQRGTRRGISAR